MGRKCKQAERAKSARRPGTVLPPACAHTCRLQSARPDAGEEGSRQPSPRPVPHGQVRRAACVPRPAWPWTQPRAPRCHQLGGQATASGSTHPCCVRPPGESLWVGGAPRSAAPAQPGLPPGGPGPVTDVRIQTEADASKALGHLPRGNRGCSHQGGTSKHWSNLEVGVPGHAASMVPPNQEGAGTGRPMALPCHPSLRLLASKEIPIHRVRPASDAEGQPTRHFPPLHSK